MINKIIKIILIQSILREKYSNDEKNEIDIIRLFAFIDSIWIIYYTAYKFLFQKEININTLMDLADKILYKYIIYLIIYILIIAIIPPIMMLVGGTFDVSLLSVLMAMFDLFYNLLILFILISRLILIEFYSIDFLYLLINLLFIISLPFIFNREIPTIKSFYLKIYKNIPVQEYHLKDFEEKEMKKYILKIEKKLKYDYSKKDLNILKEINYFRKKNKLNELKFEYNLPDFILNDISEIFLNNSQHLFKLNNKYLFKYKIGEFENNFKNKDKELIDILLKNDLEIINIIVKDNMQFILIY